MPTRACGAELSGAAPAGKNRFLFYILFRYNSQSERVGSVVFGQEPVRAMRTATGNIVAQHDGTRGRMSSAKLEEHFLSAAGQSSPAIYSDLRYKIDEKPTRPRLHMASEVDEVVFGHDVDRSDMHQVRTWEGDGP